MILRCYLYDNNLLNKFLKKIYLYINAHKIIDAIIKKSYLFGYHIAIKTDNNILIEYIKLNHSVYVSKSSINYEKMSKMIIASAQMEEVSQSCLPIKKEGTLDICDDDQSLLPTNDFYSKVLLNNIYKNQTEYLSNIYEDWINLSIDEQNYRVVNLFYSLADLNPKGIKFGYLGARSNFEYFKEQLKDVKDGKTKEWYEYITYRNKRDIDFISNGLELYYKDKLKKYSLDNLYINNIKMAFKKGIENNEVKINKFYTAKTFFDRHSHSSEFHELYYKNKKFTKEYKNMGFLLYRLILSSIYSIFPELSISALRKQKIMGLASESVENYFNINYVEVYNEWNEKGLSDSTEE